MQWRYHRKATSDFACGYRNMCSEMRTQATFVRRRTCGLRCQRMTLFRSSSALFSLFLAVSGANAVCFGSCGIERRYTPLKTYLTEHLGFACRARAIMPACRVFSSPRTLCLALTCVHEATFVGDVSHGHYLTLWFLLVQRGVCHTVPSLETRTPHTAGAFCLTPPCDLAFHAPRTLLQGAVLRVMPPHRSRAAK